jgi:hypothetical protein
MEVGEVGAEAVAIIAVEEEAVVDSGTELMATIEEDHVDVETPEEVAGEITQEVLSTRTILRILWTKTNVPSVATTGICKSHVAITRKYSPSTWTRRTMGKIKEISENMPE